MASHKKTRRSPGRLRRVFPLVAGIALLLVGAAAFFYPAASDIAARGRGSAALAEMRESAGGTAASSDGTAYRSKEGDSAYEALEAYNASVLDGTAGAVNDPFAFQADELETFGLPDGIMGTITIPAMGVELPLYLGASSDNLALGAGIIAGTSLPLGEETSNTVIAAHRGVNSGLTMFRDIEQLSVGDQVIIETPWDTLVYRVSSFEVIDPTDVEALAIQEGRDMVTLFTCHPYGHNYQRILVFCDRDETTQAEAAPSVLAGALTSYLPTWSTASPLLTLEGVLRVIGLILLIVCGVMLVAHAVRFRRRRRVERPDPPNSDPPAVHGRHFGA